MHYIYRLLLCLSDDSLVEQMAKFNGPNYQHLLVLSQIRIIFVLLLNETKLLILIVFICKIMQYRHFTC